MTQHNRNSVTILVGLPASGKSTARANAVATGPAEHSYQYSTDDKVDELAAQLGTTYDQVWESYIKEVTKQCDDEVKVAIEAGRNVLWDQTNMSRKKRQKILRLFDNNYRKECICILPPMNDEQEAELQRRLESRPGKKIPDFVMRNMRSSFQLPSVNEGFNRVLYFDVYGKMVDRNTAADFFGG